MICAIHQPNFFPWLGYFNKIYQADIFVFMDDVAYPKSGKSMGSYTNRVSILSNGKSCYISCPVQRQGGPQLIRETMIDCSKQWSTTNILTLQHAYKRSPFYSNVSEFIFSLMNYEEISIAEYNSYVIQSICKFIKLPSANFVMQSSLATDSHSTKLLIEIIKNVGADIYLYGNGAKGYQQDKLFEQHNIELMFQDFRHPIYRQLGDDFVNGLSIIDSLFMLGPDGTRELIINKE